MKYWRTEAATPLPTHPQHITHNPQQLQLKLICVNKKQKLVKCSNLRPNQMIKFQELWGEHKHDKRTIKKKWLGNFDS